MVRLYRISSGLLVVCLLAMLAASAGRPSQAEAQAPYRVLLPVLMVPKEVNVQNYLLRDLGDRSVVTGEVWNGLDQTLFLVYVTVRGYNAQGALVSSNSGHVLLTHTPSGGRNPFRIELAGAGIRSVDFELSWSLRNRDPYTTLPIFDAHIVHNNGADEFRGLVRNFEKLSIRNARVAVTFYDAAGRVVDAASADVGSKRITSGSSAVYIIRLERPVSYARYELRAEGGITATD
jgi:hypothetical protein